MFKQKENRFITRRIDSDIPKEIQVDYLQIFEFEKKIQDKKLIITHRQEKPTYQKEFELKLETNLLDFDISKSWVIDDGVNQTMLLPEEY